MTHFNPDYNIQWCYNERHHGKGPMDDVGGAVKNMIFQHVKSKKCVTNGAKDFAEYANKIINGISCLYLAENEIIAEPQDIKTSPKILRTLKVHKVLRTYHEDNVCKMEFYELADETDPFHIKWYRKESAPEVCGYNELPLSYEIDQKCSYCKERYKGKWLKCKLCDKWFQEVCFEKKQHHVLFHYFVVKFSCLHKSVLLFTVQWKLVAFVFPQNYLLKPSF